MVARLADWTTSGTPSNATGRTNLELLRGNLVQSPGGQTQEALTISSGAVVPTGALCIVDTEGAAATDDLDTVTQTNLPAGSIVIIRSTDAARVITVTQAGNLLLRDAKSVVLRSSSHWVMLARVSTAWVEIDRNLDNELDTVRALTTATTLVASDSGATLTNTGAGGALVHTLPAATVGMRLRIRVTVAQAVRLDAVGADTITDDNGTTISGPGGNTSMAGVIGNAFNIECFEAAKWVVTYSRGTLTTT